MGAEPIPYTAKVSVRYEAISERGTLKPTHLLRLFEDVAEGWWLDVVGVPRWTYFTRHRMRVLVRHVATHTPPVGLRPEAELHAELAVACGPDARSGGYGARDTLTLTTADGRPAARWSSQWYWLDWTGDTPRPRMQPPPEFPLEQRELTAPPRRRQERTDAVGSFVWSERETDLNNHVFFVSFLERLHNTLADAAVDTAGLDALQCWYLRPGVRGQRMTAAAAEQPDAYVVELRDAATDTPTAVAEFRGTPHPD